MRHGHRRVLGLIQRCRTGELGAFAYACESCGTRQYLGRSCGNRHCPNCQHDKTQRWLTKQTERLIPAHYFLVTFTVPRQVAMVLRDHQRDGYDALFEASSQAMIEVASATKALQDAQLGFFGVLHTWGRDPLVYHPHISNNRIEYCDEEDVVYRYTPSGTSSSKRRRVTGREFVAGFLQHVLPPGFQKIRDYGWMSPNSRISLDLVRWLVWIHRGWTYWLGSGHAPRDLPKPRPNVACRVAAVR